MARLTLGMSGRKTRKATTKKKTTRAHQGYWRQNQLKPMVSTMSRLYAPHLPAQQSYNLRLAFSQIANVLATADGTLLTQSMIQPRTNVGALNDNLWPGGLLALMRIYDKCQVLKCKATARISNRTNLVNTTTRDITLGAAAICFAAVSQETAAVVVPNTDNVDRLRDLPFSQYKHLGLQSSGHDVVQLQVAVDIEKFIAGPQDTLHAVRRTNNTVNTVAIGNSIMQQTPTAVLLIVPELSQADRPAQTTLNYYVEFEFEYSCVFSGLRRQDRNVAEANVPLDLAIN